MTPWAKYGGSPATDRYFYGWRYVRTAQENGTWKSKQVPLTEWDVLHPQEDDFICHNQLHHDTRAYAQDAIRWILQDRPGTRVFSDHRIDWQVPGIEAYGPDVIALTGLTTPWVSQRGTFPIRDMNATVLAVVEITSQTTRDLDFDEKVLEYHEVGVPYYILVDFRKKQGKNTCKVLGFMALPIGFVRIRPDSTFGIWVPTLEMWFGAEEDPLVCWDREKARIPSHKELRGIIDAPRRVVIETARADGARALADAETVRANEARALADAEKALADEARALADAEKARADDLTRKFAELEAELRRLRGEAPPGATG